MKSKNTILIFGIILVMLCSIMAVSAAESLDSDSAIQLYKEKRSFSNQLLNKNILKEESPVIGLHGPTTALSGQDISINTIVKNINTSAVKKGSVTVYFDDHEIKTQDVKTGSVKTSYRIPKNCKGSHIITAVYINEDNDKIITTSYTIEVS